MRFFGLILCLLSFSSIAIGGTISGRVVDQNNNPLGFTSIIVKGSLIGTSANGEGFYSLQLDPGDYVLVAQHVGYKSVEQKIKVTRQDAKLDFILPLQQYDLGNVVVKNNEDPAYEIIRNAIKKKSTYENELKKFSTDVYIKGQLQLRDYPKWILGEKVDFEDGDTSKRKMIFLSETVARYSVDEPDRKVEVLSTKVSGRSDAFGFSNPQIFSFYQNIIKLGNLNPRGFVSPIADNAFNFYRFKFEGTFFENNQMINRIRVIPKRTYEPLFNGYINIIENDWRIHSTQLVLYKENQMQFVDTLTIEQVYVPVGKIWVIKQQTIYPAIRFFGFDAFGSFVQVYDNFDLNPKFPKKFFDNTILKFYDSSNKRPAEYWDTVRPIPLLNEEIKDYKSKDSLEKLRQDPKYLDSLDRRRNRPNINALILRGQTFHRSKSKVSVEVDPLTEMVSFNSVEGLTLDISPTYRRRFFEGRRNRLTITPAIRYGFSNTHLNINATVAYRYGKVYESNISFSGGRKVIQFNNINPVRVFSNTQGTLLFGTNFMKIYEAGYVKATYSKVLGSGFSITGDFEFQDRISLENTTTYVLRKASRERFTPNISMPANKASMLSVNVRWRPGNKYIEYPDRKVSVGSKYPTFGFSLTQGIRNFLGSDVDYTKWRLTMSDNLNAKLAGTINYWLGVGGFINNNNSFLPDFAHYNGNQYGSLDPRVNVFQLMPYYEFSNSSSFFATSHIDYHLNGLLTNKIPVFKKFNWFLVAGSKHLFINSNNYYGEVSLGLENIFKLGKFDFIQSYDSRGLRVLGFRYTILGF